MSVSCRGTRQIQLLTCQHRIITCSCSLSWRNAWACIAVINGRRWERPSWREPLERLIPNSSTYYFWLYNEIIRFLPIIQLASLHCSLSPTPSQTANVHQSTTSYTISRCKERCCKYILQSGLMGLTCLFSMGSQKDRVNKTLIYPLKLDMLWNKYLLPSSFLYSSPPSGST
jgi:hypothetical protein